MATGLRVLTSSRLHFGLLSFGRKDIPEFGGVGVMIDEPAIEFLAWLDNAFSVHGPLTDRVLAAARRVSVEYGMPQAGMRVEVLQAPPQHAGLGVGTQLSLAVTAAWLKLQEIPLPEPARLATLAGRGLRSAVGTHGFYHGGFIYEAGKPAEAQLGTLIKHVALPKQWRFVLLISPPDSSSVAGLSGDEERLAFAALPPVELEVTQQLWNEVDNCLLPSAMAGDFDQFSQSLFRYGLLAGSCFAPAQGGPFSSSRLARLVKIVQAEGVVGVGQSSWGPTLYALVEDSLKAELLIDRLVCHSECAGIQYVVAAPAENGATLEPFSE